MSSENQPPPRRVIVYIDGFNLYFGLKAMNWKRSYWLDYPRYANVLAASLTDVVLVSTKYFTARVKSPADKVKRQGNYLDALTLRGNIEIIYGDYREEDFQCTGCNRPNFKDKEKQTDVSIAVELIMDAYRDQFDVAILISGDSDLVPAIKAVKEINPQKQIIACFPPKRHSKEIKRLTNGEIHINEIDLRNCQLPNEIQALNGYVIKRPDSWK
jgi:uncharacterized LabA/DUF88 family protein